MKRAIRSRGGIATGVGAALLALAMPLPWISVPGGDFIRGLMAFRGVAVPGHGPAWRSFPLLAVAMGLLVVLALALVFLNSTRRRLRVSLAGATAGLGLLILVVLVDRLFAGRGAFTAVGAGGYLGVAGIATILAGAGLVVRGPSARPARRRPRVAPPVVESPPVPWTWVAAGCAAILAAYLATRISFVSRFPYFLDEALYANYAGQVADSLDRGFVALEIGQGPLFSWLAAVWVKLGFGTLTAVRLVSVTAGLLTVAVVGWLARSLWGAAAGGVAAALCVLLPFFLVHDGIGIYEPLVTLIMAAALLLQLELARRPRLWVAALLGLVLAAGFLTKQNTLPAIALLPLSLLCFDWSDPGWRRRLTTWGIGVGIVVALVAAADLWQRSSSYYEQREEATKSILLWPARSVGDVLDDPFGLVSQNWTVFRPALFGYVTLPLLLAAAAGAVLSWRTRRGPTVVLVAWVAVPFAIGMMFQLRPYPRHAMFLVPAVLVLAAYAVVAAVRLAWRRLTPVGAAAACAAGTALLLAPALILDARVLAHPATARYPGLDYWQYVAGWPAGGPWRSTKDLLERRATGREVVVLTPGPYSVLDESLDDRYVLTDTRSPLAPRAQFALYDTAGFPVDPKGFAPQLVRARFKRIARFARPAGPCSGPLEPACGGAVLVFERR